MYIENKGDTVAMNGSVDFTADGLGIVPSTIMEVINAFTETIQLECCKLLKTFGTAIMN